MPKINLGKVVPTINNKVPQNGTLTIKAEDIPFDGDTSVKGQINNLYAEVGNLEINKADKTDLNQTNSDVNAINLRIDNLVIPISPENVNVEVTDAHNSIVKNKNFASLKERLEESEEDLVTHKHTYANHLKGLITATPLVNIENPNLLLDNSCINWENGDIISNASFFASGYLPVVKGQLYGYVGVETRFAFYNTQKEYAGKQTEIEDIRKLEDTGGGTDGNNVSAFYFRSPIDGYFRHSIHKDRYNGFCFMAINNHQELYDCRSSGVYPAYNADNQYQYLNLTDDIESINAEIASKNSKLFLTPDSNQTYIKELFLTGVDPERELLIKQIDYIYPMGGRYRTAIFLSYEDDRNKTVARFLYYSDTAEFGKDNSVIFVTEDNDSGISGYALIDFSSFEQGTRINPYIRLNKMIYTDIKANKTIYENGVVMLNKQMENYVIQASRSANEQTYPNPALPLEFIHFSDIHQIEIVWRHVC